MGKEEVDYAKAEISCSVDRIGSHTRMKGGGEGVLIALAVLIIKFAKKAGVTTSYILTDVTDTVKELEESNFGNDDKE